MIIVIIITIRLKIEEEAISFFRAFIIFLMKETTYVGQGAEGIPDRDAKIRLFT
jgi:hypothetical protein